MTLNFWKHRRILPQIILITVIPPILMFIAVLTFSYYSRSQEVAEEINERGHLAAALVAEISEYPVATGDMTSLNRTLQTILAADESIIAVTISDDRGRDLIQQARAPDRLSSDSTLTSKGDARALTFTAPITRHTLTINELELTDPLTSGKSLHPRKSQTLGNVHLVMTSQKLMAKQQRRVFVGATIATAAFALAVMLGAWLAAGITRPLLQIIKTVRQIRGGHYAVAPTTPATGEIGELQSALFEMAASVADTRRDLESKVQIRTAEMRRLLHTAQHAVEEERRYLSRELHDHFNAELIVIRLEAQQVVTLAEDYSSANIADIRAHAASLMHVVNDLYRVARSIVRGLRPEILETLGLQSALEEIIKSYDDLHSTCKFEYEYNGDFSKIDDNLAISAYRIAQEALANIARHAHASRATLRLTTADNFLSLSIQDNGVGFNLDDTHAGVGLIGMRERVHALGGSLRLQSAPGAGTSITLMFPLTPNHGDSGASDEKTRNGI